MNEINVNYDVCCCIVALWVVYGIPKSAHHVHSLMKPTSSVEWVTVYKPEASCAGVALRRASEEPC